MEPGFALHSRRSASHRDLPASLPAQGVLHLVVPEKQTRSTLRRQLKAGGFRFQVVLPHVLSVITEHSRLGTLAMELARALSDEELRDSRCLLLPDGVLPSPQNWMRMQSLQSFVASVGREWLREVLQSGRLETHFQPILSVQPPYTIFAHECLLRGRGPDGSLLNPGELFQTARCTGLLFHLDLAARLTAIRGAIHHRLSGHVFINFNPTTINDPDYCLRATREAIRTGNLSPERIVFEVTEGDEIREPERLRHLFECYRSAGFQVALDDLGAGYASLSLLTRLRPDFVKLDMQLIRGVDQDPYKAEVARMLLTMARNLGVKTVAEGIETEAEWRWFREHGADYVQGYYFARPGAPPPTPVYGTA